jgi:hypothetical protein
LNGLVGHRNFQNTLSPIEELTSAHASRRAVSRVVSTSRIGRRHECQRSTSGGVRHNAESRPS